MSQDEFNKSAFAVAWARDYERSGYKGPSTDKFYIDLFNRWGELYPPDENLPTEVLTAAIALEDHLARHMPSADQRGTWLAAFLRVSGHFKSDGMPIDKTAKVLCPPNRARTFCDDVPNYMKSIIEQRMPIPPYEAMLQAERLGQLSSV
jgi:hypothetical protein